jgi:hypothetical protein
MMGWLNIDFDSGVEANDSDNFCDDDSKNGGDDDKDNYVDGGDNGNYSSTRSFDRFCVMKSECTSPTRQITSVIYN